MTMAVIKDTHLKFMGKKYFRTGAEDVVLGSVGYKRMPLLGANYLEVWNNMRTQHLTEITTDEIEIDYEQSTNVAFGGTVTIPGFGKISGDRASTLLRTAELRLIKISALPAQIVTSINDMDQVKNFFTGSRRKWRRKRIAHQVFSVVSAEISEALQTEGGATIKGTIKGIEIDLTGGGGEDKTSTVTLPKGTTFAYLLFKPHWNSNRFRKIERAVGGRDDQWATA